MFGQSAFCPRPCCGVFYALLQGWSLVLMGSEVWGRVLALQPSTLLLTQPPHAPKFFFLFLAF